MDIKIFKKQLVDGSPSERWDALRTFIKEGIGSEIVPSLMTRIIDERADQTGEDRGKLMEELSILDMDAKNKRMVANEEIRKAVNDKVMKLVSDDEFVSKYSHPECPRCHQKSSKLITKENQACKKCGIGLYQQVVDRVYTEAGKIAEKECSNIERDDGVKKYTIKDKELDAQVDRFSKDYGIPYDQALIGYMQMETAPEKVDIDVQFKYHKFKNPGISDAEALRKIR